MSAPLSEILARSIYVDGANRPFGELTLEQVRGRADELRGVVGFGPTARVAPVARAWRELSMAMEQAGVVTVAQLEGPVVQELAPKLWVGSLL
jgi:hypothetical protein